MDIQYIINDKYISKDQFSELRRSVNWNCMDDYFEKFIDSSYMYICCYDAEILIGFLDDYLIIIKIMIKLTSAQNVRKE